MMFEIVLGIVGIIVTIISIVVTIISIRQSCGKQRHQKATAARPSEMVAFLKCNY